VASLRGQTPSGVAICCAPSLPLRFHGFRPDYGTRTVQRARFNPLHVRPRDDDSFGRVEHIVIAI
jgi:hypothetical protein